MDVYMEKWLIFYEAAKKYYQENKNLRVKEYYLTENNLELGRWIKTQRLAYKNRNIPQEERKNRIRPLTDKQVEKLEKIGMVWDATIDYKKYWKESYEKAKRYYEEHGTLRIDTIYATEEEMKIYNWLKYEYLRYTYTKYPEKNKNNIIKPLTEEQMKLLEDIEINGKIKTKNWEKMYKEAKEYYEQNGNLIISKTYIEKHGKKLYNWINTQREAYNNRSIPEEERKTKLLPLQDEYIEKLDEIGMVWDLNEYKFMTKPITKKRQKKLEKRFLEFLSTYIKENKNEIESYNDIIDLTNEFSKTIGNKQKHLKRRG